MWNMMSFINLFICPSISVSVLYRRKQENIVSNITVLLRYLIFVAINIPPEKIIIDFLEKRMEKEILISSSYYTCVAIVVAYIMPYLLEIFKNFINISFEIRKK